MRCNDWIELLQDEGRVVAVKELVQGVTAGGDVWPNFDACIESNDDENEFMAVIRPEAGSMHASGQKSCTGVHSGNGLVVADVARSERTNGFVLFVIGEGKASVDN